MKVLVVEDDQDVVDVIEMCLRMRWPGANVVSTGSGSEAVRLVGSETPDIVILDLGLPDVDGVDVLHELRRFSDVPVIIVSARSDETSRVRGLELGADDYVIKPFSHTELLARMRAVLRRAHRPELWDQADVVDGRGLSIDLAGGRLQIEGREVSLTPTEWNLLSYLVRNEGRVISYQVLAEKVWGTDYLDNSVIRMCVRRLRLKLGDNPQVPSIIRSHRGLGYSFVRPPLVQEQPGSASAGVGPDPERLTRRFVLLNPLRSLDLVAHISFIKWPLGFCRALLSNCYRPVARLLRLLLG